MRLNTKENQKSFVNRNFVGKDFSFADLRGVNFSNANLTGAIFCNSKTGLPNYVIYSLIITSLILLAISGTGVVQTTVIFLSMLEERFKEEFTIIPSVIVFICMVVFCIVTIFQGVLKGSLALSITLSIAVPIGIILGGVLAGLGPVALAMAWLPLIIFMTAIAVAVIRNIIDHQLLITFLDSIGGLIIFSTSGLTWNVLKYVTLRGNGAIAKSLDVAGNGNLSLKIATVLISVIILGLGYYVGFKSIQRDHNFQFTEKIAVFLASLGGTNFHNSNLTNADFSQCSLRNSNLTKANLTRTNFLGCQGLNLCRLGDSYLESPQIQKLVTKGWGKNQNFDLLNLEGINLIGANLEGASFIGTNLTNANFKEANLTNALLIQTQLADADLTFASLTSAVIQDFNLTVTTKLEGIDCKYCYMRLPTSEDRDSYRKPDNKQKEFYPGEFLDFISPLQHTLDLYHNQKPNLKAVFEAFGRLVNNHPESKLEIIAIEKRGKDKFLLKIKTTKIADYSELSREYFENYNELKSLANNDNELLNPEHYNQISGLEGLLIPSANIDLVNDTINQLDDQRLKHILNQLKHLTDNHWELFANQSKTIFEQIINLAELVNYPENIRKTKSKISLRILKGIIIDLPITKDQLIKQWNDCLLILNEIFT